MTERTDRTIRPIVVNRRALYDYEIIQRYEAGIALTGTEVKSIRAGKLNLLDAYAMFPSKNNDELLLLGLHINPYDFGNRENHEPLRPRKLILHKTELHRLRRQLEEKGLTIIPLKLYFSGPYIKVELGVGRGKKLFDKRHSIKDKEMERAKRKQSSD